ncbi:Apoptosis inhibitor 5 [Lunasporangiospora selenospora]|uniref:Apoptosis inhibitor 5 n=1 Tax=Lunasporangiospora selenospora TaxID=979761 RepID=A0A9P6FQ36_9FUNG|nr:Apoptosis inhibitor 5 [Lunasporangiospora selenospora]
MTDLDAIYNAYNEIRDAKENAPKHQDAYDTIINAAQGSDGAKRLAAQFIPVFFKHFPDLHNKAIDGAFDLCEDESSLIRQSAIKGLPVLCKDGPQHTIKIADVLCQLLQLDDQDLVAVQGALQTLLLQSPREVLAVLFRQGVKGTELRERSLDFITNNVLTMKDALFKDPAIELFFIEEMQKSMSSVSNSELETLAKIIMETRPYQTGKLDLNSLLKTYVSHITSEGTFNVGDAEAVKRVLVTGKVAGPLFKRAISADLLLEFYAVNILPREAFSRLADKQRLSLLKLYSDAVTTGYPSDSTLKDAESLIVNLIMDTVPSDMEASTKVEFGQVECLVIVLYFISTKEPNITDREHLLSRLRSLYMLTQTQISALKQVIAAENTKPPAQDKDATLKSYSRSLLIHNNIYQIAKELMKPKTVRSSKLQIHPSWRPIPEPVKPSAPKSTATSNPVVSPKKPTVTLPPKKGPANGSNSSNSRSGSNTTKAAAKPGAAQQHTSPNTNKRKAEQESGTKPKKILRRQGLNAGGSSPGGNSGSSGSNPGGGGGGGQISKSQAITSLSAAQASQHGRKRSNSPKTGGAVIRTPSTTSAGSSSSSSPFEHRNRRDGNGRINFLNR